MILYTKKNNFVGLNNITATFNITKLINKIWAKQETIEENDFLSFNDIYLMNNENWCNLFSPKINK